MTDFNINLIPEEFVYALVAGLGGFLLSMALTPIYTYYAFKYKWWKQARTTAVTGEKATMYQKLHAAKHTRHIPTMAGVIFVVSVSLVTLLANLSRSETWLPLAAMLGAGSVGLLDDRLNIRNSGGGIAGMRAKIKSILIFIVAAIGAYWFYYKLGVSDITIPFVDSPLHLGWLVMPMFVFVLIATANAVNISDGLDGLAGGLSVSAFSVYAIIAIIESRYGVAGFCLTMVGALLSYTWFNIFPARFFMGDSGSFALGTSLAVVAWLTDTVFLLPIIGFVFVAEVSSSLLQITSKKLRGGKKIFKIAPIHHHFEAIGWPETKVTMRFWVLGQVFAAIGLIIFLIDKIY